MELDKIFWLVEGCLVLFGIGYDQFVGNLEKQGHERGFTAFLVVVGTLVTLAGLALGQGLEIAIYVALLFVGSGTPMIVGSIRRYVRQRAEDEQRARDDVRRTLGA